MAQSLRFDARTGGSVLVDIDPIDYAPPVPAQVSKLQLVRELRERGLWDGFKAALALDETSQEDWNLANYVERHHPRTAEMALAFGLDSDGIDQLFLDAAAQ